MKLMNHQHFSFTQLLHVDTWKSGNSQNVAENVKRLCRLSLEGLLTVRVIHLLCYRLQSQVKFKQSCPYRHRVVDVFLVIIHF